MATIARRPTKVQSTFKIDPAVKRHVDLLADAFGTEKSRIVEEAVNEYVRRHEGHVRSYLEQRSADLDQLREAAPARRTRGYAGGPVTGQERSSA